ncbi:thiol:disulfide interchange protein tlpA [Oceanobacillus oncorhynchi subsp. incaldanensis]|uniref:Thiol-disulfide oxidoreductase ResA n=2 Tax=Oceanobacillus TaxID=182709 RepID=A0A0A1MU26_9BACI|nr:TlpA disulfide reductase family protein [Oceanobacillus oncorhynchi]MDM8102258.1 TlpA disulfide reductase family protein [Oceanobacillus oncorhynchi]UUI41521.1 TlpA family protein disulfide reductase [Oceanobacillus oncorhynchi]GIO17649.1 thiol:disulfide interchange protein tlpA [Oceanobacillus oncorhynchi subsp. incaldanensis]CEI83032.1 Thiol-disulfide oxidoreductase ResA [Oceanobacillus oncorhynchi]
MKKWIFTMIIVGMIGWALYDFIDSSRQSTDEFVPVEENSSVEEDVREQLEAADNEEGDSAAGENTEVGLEVGNMAPDFELQTLAGETVKLSDYRGKKVMINFWATWCPPCRAEMPDMEAFYQDKDIVILAVNLTETENNLQQVQDFVNEYELTFPILLDEKIEVAEQYMIQPIPTSYMINSNGVVAFKAFGSLNYDFMVQEFEKMK